jgi:hypothetical protein
MQFLLLKQRKLHIAFKAAQEALDIVSVTTPGGLQRSMAELNLLPWVCREISLSLSLIALPIPTPERIFILFLISKFSDLAEFCFPKVSLFL